MATDDPNGCKLPLKELVVLDNLQYYSNTTGKDEICFFFVGEDGSLTLWNYDIVEIQAQTIQTSVLNLDLAYNRLTKFPKLSAPSLTQLVLSYNPIGSFDDIVIPDTVNSLYVAGTNIASMEHVKLPMNVTYLHVGFLRFKTFPKLNGLQTLRLDGNPIQSIDDVGIASSLLELGLSNTSITQVQGTKVPSSLTTLDLSYNQMEEFPELEAPGLRTLFVNNNPIKSLPANAIPQTLQYLNISGTALSDINGVKFPPNLLSLDISDTSITSIMNIDAPSLQYFNALSMKSPIQLADFQFPNQSLEICLSYNPNINFEGGKFPKGSKLRLHSCGLTSIDGIPFPEQMPLVVLHNNSISSFPQFPHDQGSIETIYLGDNNMTRFANISLPPKLTNLYLGGNYISEIRDIDFPASLQELDLSGNPLTYFEISRANYDKWEEPGSTFRLTWSGNMKRCRNKAQPMQVSSSSSSVCVLAEDKWNAMHPQNFVWLPINDTDGSATNYSIVTSEGLSVYGIVGIVVGCLGVIAFVGTLFVLQRKQRSDESSKPGSTGDGILISEGIGAMMSDPAILAAKIPMDRIHEHSLVGKGGFGEVYKGAYKGQVVAIKKLSTEHRKDTKCIAVLLSEVKLLLRMDHRNIVQFIGVAWDALTDVCLVMEFMGAGDLRNLLIKYKKSSRPRGLDGPKLGIAKDIVVGLTYLHCLDPKVLHRDLKSSNVLLSEQLDAKLTDFNVSRERSEHTMTTGVGTRWWMAPEVILGGRYDEKADIYSFGVVLSELDTHELPYSDQTVDATGQPVPEAVLLQQVITGEIQVHFSDCTTDCQELLLIARRCLSLDPNDRPTAAEVSYQLRAASKAMERAGTS